MKIHITFSNSLYDCALKITDSNGTRAYFVPLATDSEASEHILDAEVFGNSFNLQVSPMAVDYKACVDRFGLKGWQEKLAGAVIGKLLSVAENSMLAVGCTYHISDIYESMALKVDLQLYTAVSSSAYDLLELYPLIYMFYEVSCGDKRFEPVSAFGLNRKSVLKCARTLAMTDFGIHLVVTYPVHIGAIKYLTSNKRIYKNLRKFHFMSPEKRQKYLDEI